MSIKLKIEGFEDLLKEIESAGGNINKACDSAIRQSAQTMQKELQAQMSASGVPGDLVNAMPTPSIENKGNRFSAKVGFSKGAYDPKNPSAAFKVIFLNYGTPKRTKHGKVKARGFIQKAKRRAKPQIKKEQEIAFKKILERLKR